MTRQQPSLHRQLHRADVDGTATTVTVNILGSDDAAVLSSATVPLTETDAAADISTAGQLTISDIDSPQAFVAQSDVAGLQQSSRSTRAAPGPTPQARRTTRSSTARPTPTHQSKRADGVATTVAVNILGSDNSGGAVVGHGVSARDRCRGSDRRPGRCHDRQPAGLGRQSDVAGSYGVFAIDESGAWTYTAASAHDAFVDGQTYTPDFGPCRASTAPPPRSPSDVLGSNDAAVLSSPRCS